MLGSNSFPEEGFQRSLFLWLRYQDTATCSDSAYLRYLYGYFPYRYSMGTKWQQCVHSRRSPNVCFCCTFSRVHWIPDLSMLLGLVGFLCASLWILRILRRGKICSPGCPRVLIRTWRVWARSFAVVVYIIWWCSTISVTLTNIGWWYRTLCRGGFHLPPQSCRMSRETVWDYRTADTSHRANSVLDGL